ncbi:MAG: SusC/RagA family TonB-linked outer membrane protein [Capnocytophaga sp.]|nr:SusC/RagA family TonB-linked outer membrane protein [Capnocytophaga sp.]
MRLKLVYSVMLFFLALQFTFAQKNISGVVKDDTGEPVPLATVILKGTSHGVATELDGRYTIQAKQGDVLIFTAVGYQDQEVRVGANTKLNVTLKTEVQEIGEVVIIGYGKSSTKTKATTATTTVSAAVLENRPTASFLTSIQGAAPGISISSGSGSPGSGKINVQIRGNSSLGASNEPLYVIDGLMSSGNEFRNLNQNDIEDISILKDAQATSIYGNFGANGVVVITTKSGKYNSGLKVSYDTTTSFLTLPKHHYDLTSSRELLSLQRAIGQGTGVGMTDEQIANYATQTNWEREFFRTAFNTQHNVGLRYGGENFTSYTSLGYLDNKGNVKNTDFKRFTFRSNINGKSNDKKFTYSAQIGLGYSKRNQLDEETNSDIANNSIQNPLLGVFMPSILERNPYANGRELFNAIGRNFSGKNAWVLYEIINGGIQKLYTQTNITANGSVSYKLTDYLTIGNKTGVTYKNNFLDMARTPEGYLSLVVASSSNAKYGGFETLQNIFDTTINSVTQVNFDKEIGLHTLGVGAYIDYLRGFYSYTQQTQNGLDPLNWTLGSGTGYVPFNTTTPNLYRPSVSAGEVKAGTLAFIGTLDYDYNSKYGLSATIRRDASYRFSSNNRWETFWSVGGRWNIDKEDFMLNSIFNELKLRASYGTSGNQNLTTPSNNQNPLFLNSTLVRDTYSSSTGYLNLPGYSTSLSNSNARWEKVAQANIGVDFGLFKNKLNGSVDVYEKKTTDMYLSIPISAVNGTYTIKGNNGDLRNRGIEASLRYTPINNHTNKYKVSVFANFAYNQNKIMALPSEDLSNDLVHAIGGPAYQWQLYRYVGVNPDTGNYWFRKADGSLTESPVASDRVLTGKSVYAPYSGGFGLDAEYKGVYLSALFSYRYGGWSYDNLKQWLNNPEYVDRYNAERSMLNAWTPNNRITDYASLTANNHGSLGSSDKYLRKTDFIKLKNITLGYNVNSEVLDKLSVKSIKIFVMGENLFTWTEWQGFDPEPVKSTPIGVYPNPRTYSIGLNVEF